MQPTNKFFQAFSLAELMIVMLILTIILAATMPILSKRAKIKAAATTATSSIPAGTIFAFGGSFAPSGNWLICDGSAVSRTTYSSLYAIIGTSYGTGDGSTTFNIPDLRGIFIRGAGTSTKNQRANNTYFSGTLGNYQNDKFQGHMHEFDYTGASNSGDALYGGGAGISEYLTSGITNSIVSDGINGAPLTGSETNPANLALNYIIKY